MAISVTFYDNASDKRYRTKQLTQTKVCTCEFYEASSVINPKVLVDYDADLFMANYMYIPTLHRYYFITDMTVLNGRQILVSGHTDVLSSFDLSEVVGVLSRQGRSANWNAYIPDKELDAFTYTRTQTVAFTPIDTFVPNQSMILTIAGDYS